MHDFCHPGAAEHAVVLGVVSVYNVLAQTVTWFGGCNDPAAEDAACVGHPLWA